MEGGYCLNVKRLNKRRNERIHWRESIKRFDVYLVILDPTKGREIKKTRPATIISPNGGRSIPEVVDEERTYVFAPDIGMVILQNNGWSTKKLTSAIINGSTIID